MLGTGRAIRLSLAIVAVVACADCFVLREGAMADKVPLEDAIINMAPQDVWQRFHFPQDDGEQDEPAP